MRRIRTTRATSPARVPPATARRGAAWAACRPRSRAQDKSYLLQQLKEFKAGNRPATIMHQHAKGYTDEQLELIAGYFAGMKAGPGAAAPAGRGGGM